MAKEYYLYVRGQKVKVSEDIYKVYWQEKEHEKYLEQVDKKNHLLFFLQWLMTVTLETIDIDDWSGKSQKKRRDKCMVGVVLGVHRLF